MNLYTLYNEKTTNKEKKLEENKRVKESCCLPFPNIIECVLLLK